MRKAKAAAATAGTLDAPGRALVLGSPSAPPGSQPAAPTAPGRLSRPMGPGAIVAHRIRGALRRWLEEEM
ncbi:MAG TPA: hypothetical protein VMU15_18025 [Anaeromyxobacter sp.]|nr:hypothetical protein [Anaeromyxobacter sp.]